MKTQNQSVVGAQSGEDEMRAWLVEFGPVTLLEAFASMDGAEVRKQVDLHYPGGLAAWVAAAQGALPPVNGPAGVSSFPVLACVLDSGGNAVSVECCHSGAQLESVRQNVGNLRLVEVPLALALRAPAMHQALGTISRCIPNRRASDESGENAMIRVSRKALGLA